MMFRWILAYIFALVSAINPALPALTVNNLTGFNARTETVAAGASVSFRGCTTSTANLTTYTFSSVDIGTAATGRLVIAAFSIEDSESTLNPGTITLGGVTMTTEATTNSLYTSRSEVASLVYDSGTTADITATWGEAITSASVCVWALYGFSPTYYGRAAIVSSVGTLSTNFDVPAGGFAVGMCSISTTNDTLLSFDSDFTVQSGPINTGESTYAYGYTFPVPTTVAGQNILCDWTSSNNSHMRIVSYEPL